ncbi:hypothetical protein [Corynebacterium pacaense]|uniref:hypothetical protein n=1 Tax=Corynebacterium pacaense TaxID=1816684 RepID=UPI0009BC4824|nr:hypothetical protein [Corynebacterium pacaense]
MQAALFPITQDELSLIHPWAARSIFWEMAPEAAAAVHRSGSPEFEKEAWLSATLLEYRSCGFNIGYANAPALSTVLYCHRDLAPGTVTMPSGPVSPDAAVISSLFIDEVFRGLGLEAALIDAALMDLVGWRVPAVEAFARRGGAAGDPAHIADTGVTADTGSPGTAWILAHGREIGLIDEAVLQSAGFRLIADHPLLPRYRMELPPVDGLLSARDAEILLAGVEAQ